MTRLYGLIGYPVEHSLSPFMHNAAFRELGIDAEYCLLPVKKGTLKNSFNTFLEKGFKGFNVTFPYQIPVMELLDTVTDEARLIGAVNTILVNKKNTTGYNTDGKGFVRSFFEAFQENSTGKSVSIVGCGGAGSAVAVQLALEGVRELLLIDIDKNRLEDMENRVRNANRECHIETIAANNDNVPEKVSVTDVFIDATPLGMKPHDPSSVLEECIQERHIVCDLVYHPAETSLIKRAKEMKARFMNGFGMLLYQGVEAFEIWTGRKAPIEVMKKALEEKVYGD